MTLIDFDEAVSIYVDELEFRERSRRTIEDYPIVLKQMFGFLDSSIKSVKDIEAHHLRDAINKYRDQKDVLTNTVTNKIRILRSFFKILHLRKFNPLNPMDAILTPRRVENQDTSYPNLSEVSQMIEHSDMNDPIQMRDLTMIALMYDLGVRSEDIRRLQIRDVKLKNNVIVIRGAKCRHKSDKQIKKVGAYAFGLLKQYLSDARKKIMGKKVHKGGNEYKGEVVADLVFPSKNRNLLSRADMCRIIKRACQRAQIEEYTPHNLKTGLLCHMIEQKADLISIKSWSQHKSISTTYEYYIRVKNKHDIEHIRQDLHPFRELNLRGQYGQASW